ncbi:PX domain-containing protein [Fusarium falciforme]|uniref:PX domain-containing protein n=1 Tax=Fusarium falciforme TaxID=195108 RepID=UPI0023008975|nr:PX domain-containing protein [Fusarium falciforme]WAO93324.1 PX domain-containing protein [Fusarium falciforme]
MAATPEGFHSTPQNDEDEEETVMHRLVHKCEQRLKSLSHSVQNSTSVRQAFDNVDNSRGRFSVWAKNIGAHKASKSTSSLEYRLRDGVHMRSSIMRALVDIKEASCWAKDIAAGERPDRTSEPLEAFKDADRDDDFVATTEFSELLSIIQASVDRLFRLSMLIRRKRPRGREPTEMGAHAVDATMDIRHIKDKFPKVKAEEWLAVRLGTAIAKRRAFISYRQLHHQRLAKQHRDSTEEGAAGSKTAPSTIATTYEEGSLDIEQQAASLARLSIVTGSTSFATAFGGDENGDLCVPALNRLKFHGIQLGYDSAFECPFCRTIQVVSSEHEWRRHIFSDLQPYVCTFQNCSSDSFSSRHEWFNHELDSHRKQWHCTKCHHINFTSASQLRSHFDSTHQGSFTDAQWPLILKACKRTLTAFGPSSCPLCFTWAPPRSEAYNAKEFCRHLGSHLQQLALTALPIAIEGLVILEDEGHDTIPDASDDNEQGAGEAVGPDMSAEPPERDIQRTHVKLVNISEKDKYLVYVVFSDGNGWELKREYQEFYDLQAKLLERFPYQQHSFTPHEHSFPPYEHSSTRKLPNLPLLPSPINHVTLALTERQVSNIDTYLTCLVNLPTDMSRSDPMLEFFKPREGDRNLPANEW